MTIVATPSRRSAGRSASRAPRSTAPSRSRARTQERRDEESGDRRPAKCATTTTMKRRAACRCSTLAGGGPRRVSAPQWAATGLLGACMRDRKVFDTRCRRENGDRVALRYPRTSADSCEDGEANSQNDDHDEADNNAAPERCPCLPARERSAQARQRSLILAGDLIEERLLSGYAWIHDHPLIRARDGTVPPRAQIRHWRL